MPRQVRGHDAALIFSARHNSFGLAARIAAPAPLPGAPPQSIRQNPTGVGPVTAETRGRPYCLIALSLLLSACASEPKVVYKRVEVPIPVRAKAPPELMRCTKNLPVPVFEDCATGYVCLNADQQESLVILLDRLDRCLSGWEEWAKP